MTTGIGRPPSLMTSANCCEGRASESEREREEDEDEEEEEEGFRDV
jgi:hypothetical protein